MNAQRFIYHRRFFQMLKTRPNSKKIIKKLYLYLP